MNLARSRLAHLALEQYVAGRFCARGGLSSAAPVLLHHAVELILKAVLAESVELGVLKKKYSHGLGKLWEAVVEQAPTLRTPSRDATITNLDAFWELRYPDKIMNEGATVTIGIRPGENPVVTHGEDVKEPPTYIFNLGDTDDVWAAVFLSIANPAAFVQHLNDHARAALLWQNERPIVPPPALEASPEVPDATLEDKREAGR